MIAGDACRQRLLATRRKFLATDNKTSRTIAGKSTGLSSAVTPQDINPGFGVSWSKCWRP
jgi:hypothetical protein